MRRKPDPIIDPHPVYQALDASAPSRQQAYRELFATGIDPDTEHDIRDALAHGLILGTEEFKDEIERTTGRRTRPGRPGRPRVDERAASYRVE